MMNPFDPEVETLREKAIKYCEMIQESPYETQEVQSEMGSKWIERWRVAALRMIDMKRMLVAIHS